jgi:hypothetical protein
MRGASLVDDIKIGRVLYLPPISASNVSGHRYQLCPDSQLTHATKPKDIDNYFEIEPNWNRWILSHHISFLMWALSVIEMDSIAADPAVIIQRMERVMLCTVAYGSMFQYARLIGSDNYARSIRPVMSQFYPGFSASWSADYPLYKQRILHLMRSPHPPFGSALKTPFMRSLREHLSTAKALVPEGPSLLQGVQGAHAREASCSGLENFVYDSLFLICRTELSRDDVIGQLRARFSVLCDDPLLSSRSTPNYGILATVQEVLMAFDRNHRPAN